MNIVRLNILIVILLNTVCFSQKNIIVEEGGTFKAIFEYKYVDVQGKQLDPDSVWFELFYRSTDLDSVAFMSFQPTSIQADTVSITLANPGLTPGWYALFVRACITGNCSEYTKSINHLLVDKAKPSSVIFLIIHGKETNKNP